MLTFNEDVQSEASNPFTGKASVRSATYNCDEPRVNRGNRARTDRHVSDGFAVSPVSISDLTTRFSNEVVRLNDLMYSDSSCSTAEKRLSQVLLNLHYLTLIAISGGNYDRVAKANNS